jgi:hypothetical protein
MRYLDIALQVKEEDGIEKNPHTLIDQTIREINKEWESGALEWIKVNRSDEWGKILTLEQRVDEMAFRGDLDGLRGALNSYRELILTMVEEFKSLKEKKAQGMFNFVERSKVARDE